MKKSLLTLSLAVLPCMSSLAGPVAVEPAQPMAEANESTPTFFDDSERGWFWYEQLPEEEKEKFRERIAIEQTQQPSKPSKPEDKPLSTAWFKVHFESYKQAAMDNPHDKEAMRTYLYLEKFMRDRAMAFGYERQKAVMAEPFLDSSSSRPLASFGMKAMNVEATKNRDALLSALGEKAGIYFFYRANDTFSENQAPLVKLLETKYGFTVRPVSLDGSSVDKELWESNLVDNGQAEAWGVKQVPALFLYDPESDSVSLISQGLQALPELKKRVVYAAERSGLISTEQADTIRGTGLYQDVNGQLSGGFPLPEDAPDTFKQFYIQSLTQGQ